MKETKKTGKDRTQQATRNEDWSDERLSSFLELLPPEGMAADYNILLKAYRGMTAELFGRFVAIYTASGRDINVSLSDNSTMLDLVSQHRKSAEYATILQSAGGIHNKS